MVEGIIYRFGCCVAWRDVPAEFGPGQRLWKRHHRYSGDGTWDHVTVALLTEANSAGIVDWAVNVDSKIIRAHQHAAALARDTRGKIELHEICWPNRSITHSAALAASVDEDPPAR